MSRPAAREWDVAILGSGMAGGILGLLLARHGAKVLILDKGRHPRFAVGESTVPHTSSMLRLTAARYDVPELAHIASLQGLRKHVGSSCGIKRHFGFVHHEEGREPRTGAANQTLIPELAHGPESHLFRQDVDAYLVHMAIRRGATVLQGRGMAGFEIGDRGVRLEDDRGTTHRARYLVDACGFASPLARELGLRSDPNPLRTHSRTLFTHMIDVPTYESSLGADDGMPRRWSQGTLHHFFEGGWLWVIPFDNHGGSTNPLCSVGLTLDPRLYPRGSEGPEEEFAAFLERFPAVRRQLRDARPVRDWVATGRLQYTSSRSVGDRYCLMSHSAGFIDALFSRGLRTPWKSPTPWRGTFSKPSRTATSRADVSSPWKSSRRA